MKGLVFFLLDLVGANRVMSLFHRGKIKVLLYHNITSDGSEFDYAVSTEEFDRHLKYLKSQYNIVSITQEGEWRGVRSDKMNVLVTFDDGFRNNVTHALPVLVRNKVSALFFLIADCVETGSPPPFMAERHGEAIANERFRTVDVQDVRSLLAAGMTVGSHSLAHRDHRRLTDEAVVDEARSSQERLQALLQIPVKTFAFPWGFHEQHHVALASGFYRRIFLTRHGFCESDTVTVPRNEVASEWQFRAAASGLLDFLKGHRQ